MNQDFMKSKLPPIHKEGGKEYYFDPVRKKLILVTPEETVRQHIISYLIDELNVPIEMIDVEVSLSNFAINSKRISSIERADIVIFNYDDNDNKYYLMAVIECKAQNVFLDYQAARQMFNYSDQLECTYCMLTNGDESICYKFDYDINDYIPIAKFPTYQDMLEGKFEGLQKPVRLSMEELNDGLTLDYVDSGHIGHRTQLNIAIPMVNFCECLWTTEHKFPAQKYKIFSVIEDYGVENIIYENGNIDTVLNSRLFVVNYKGNEKFVGIAVSSYFRSRTHIDVSIEVNNDRSFNTSLDLVVDNNVELHKNKIIFYHTEFTDDGLKNFVSRIYPQIIDGDRFYLGTLTHDRLWNLDDPEVINFVENLISYALIRDEYQKYHRK